MGRLPNFHSHDALRAWSSAINTKECMTESAVAGLWKQNEQHSRRKKYRGKKNNRYQQAYREINWNLTQLWPYSTCWNTCVRPISSVVLLPCLAGSTVTRLQHDISTTWFQTSNLIHTMTVEWNGCCQNQNTKIKKRFSKLFNIFLCIYNSWIEFGTAVAWRLKRA